MLTAQLARLVTICASVNPLCGVTLLRGYVTLLISCPSVVPDGVSACVNGMPSPVNGATFLPITDIGTAFVPVVSGGVSLTIVSYSCLVIFPSAKNRSATCLVSP